MRTLFFLWMLPLAVVAANQRMAENGIARAVIVLPDNPTAVEQSAAGELADGLRRVTGATFVILQESTVKTGMRLHVGATAASAALRKGRAWKFDEVLVAPVDDGLVIDGHPERGPIYAVDEFLTRHLGVRWWTSTESLHPSNPSPELPAKAYSHTPTFKYRESYFLDAFDPVFKVRSKINYSSLARYEIVKNKRIPPELGGDYRLYFFKGRKSAYHSFFEVLPPSVYFKDHPEWYSLVKGKRSAQQLCLSNAEMKAAYIAETLRLLREDAETNFIQVSQNDTDIGCECDACRAIEIEEGGTPAGTMIRFVNDVAEAVEKEFPKVRVDTFAYQYTRKAPTKTRPRKNVVVRLCDIECAFNRPLAEFDVNKAFIKDLRDWRNVAGGNLFIWDYTVGFWSYMLPHPNIPVLASNIRTFADAGAVGIFEQGDATCAAGEFVPLKCWLISRLLWNAAEDDNALISEFLNGYYGSAAAPILRRYIDFLHVTAAKGPPMTCFHHGVKEWIDLPDMLTAKKMMDSAVAAAEAQGAEFGARVRRERLTTDHAFIVHWDEWHSRAKRENLAWPFPADRCEAARVWLDACDSFGVISYKETTTRETFVKYRNELLGKSKTCR